jgi:glycosyltransferase involved in cell wall biosynthesis
MERFWVILAEMGREVGCRSILAYPAAGPIPPSIESAPIESVVLPIPGRGPHELLRTLELLRLERVTCVYFTDRPFSSPAYAAMRAAGVRAIINHDHSPGDRPPISGVKGSAKAALRRAPYINCDLQICVSPLIAERNRVNARIPAGRLSVVQNGIGDIVAPVDPNYIHDILGIPRGSQVCVVVARAHPYKRVDFVIEVARICFAELGLNNLYFVHCGDGPDLGRLQQIVARCGMRSRFLFAGRRNDVAQLLLSCDFAIHPARGEAFSLSILEYMRAGLAVLVPDIPTVAQAISHDVDGIVYRDGDALGAACALARMVKDTSAWKRLGTAAQRKVRTLFSADAMESQFRNAIAPLIARAAASEG